MYRPETVVRRAASAVAVIFLTWCLLGTTALAHPAFKLLPKPAHVSTGHGRFQLYKGERIVAPADTRAQWIANFLRRRVFDKAGVALKVADPPDSGQIVLRIDSSIHGPGAYHLNVNPNRVLITAADDRGLFWGVQTLRQLLISQYKGGWSIPAVKIQDAPRYPWRGVMLDVSRHFYPVSFIKKLIDLMSYYKFDVFHWHLTDDQGWRIQIKRYPRLTNVGAWRKKPDGERYGGLYTQKQIQEVVKYARERNVMVMPEIEMPAHTSAAIAAYPELSCSGSHVTVTALAGKVEPHSVDCVGKNSTFRFLENVLGKVAEWFPSPYVDIGTDEVSAKAWANCKSCAKVAKDGGFKDDEQDLHSYFVRRIEKYLASKGKTTVGWDEILQGGVSPNVIVEIWHGPIAAKKALENGNRIILAGPFYMDTPIEDRTLYDIWHNGAFVNPLFAKYPDKVLGGEAPLWSEHASPKTATQYLFPRLFAVSQALWNPASSQWSGFQRRVLVQEKWLNAQHVSYGPAGVNFQIGLLPKHGGWYIQAERGLPSQELHYTLNGSEPTMVSPVFHDVLDLHNPVVVKVAPFVDRKRDQPTRSFKFVSNLALGDAVHFAAPPAAKYDGGPVQLTNGILAGLDFNDGRWDGWKGSNMDATVDMKRSMTFRSVSIRFLQKVSAAIILPRRVSLAVSNNDRTWRKLQTMTLTPNPQDKNTFIRNITFKLPDAVTARYVRVIAINYGMSVYAQLTPWLFADEIDVR